MDKYEINHQTIPKGLEENTPEENEKIILWRYMSFSSLCGILQNNCIPLISISKFSDKSEGIILREILNKRKNTFPYAIDFAMQLCLNLTYISSWHESNNENAAMWDRYAYGSEGIAIKTNAKLLIETIQSVKNQFPIGGPEYGGRVTQDTPNEITFHKGYIIRKVKYENINPSQFYIDDKLLEEGFDKMCFFYKMIDFKDENEIRILTSTCADIPHLAEMKKSEIDRNLNSFNSQEHPTLKSLPLRINSAEKLIQEIVISPHAHDNFIDTVKKTIASICVIKDSINSTGQNIQYTPPFEIKESIRKDWV